MPSYISHIIMARDVYKKINNSNVDFKYMLTYSLGGDLTKFSKCRRACHKEKLDLFIDNIVKYIKDNHLEYDGRYLGFLYGHISHVVMDKNIHPLIYKYEKECSMVGKIKKHTMIEAILDNLLLEDKDGKRINNYKINDLFRVRVYPLRKMIDTVYEETYKTKHLWRYYSLMIFLYSKVWILFKIPGVKVLKKYTKVDEFKKMNKNVINMEEYLEYYNLSIDKTIEYITKVNKELGI